MTGCDSVGSSLTESRQAVSQLKTQLVDLSFLKEGMTYQDVLDKVKGGIQLGVQVNSSQNIEPIIVKNPYREEIFKVQNKNYCVSYILTHIIKSDGIVSDDELTPLIFEDDRLMAYGQDALFKLKRSVR